MKIRTIMLPAAIAHLVVVPGPAAQAFELKDAVAHTIQHSPAVQVSLHRYLESQAGQGVGRSGFLPVAELGYLSGRELDRTDPIRRSQGQTTQERWGWTLSLSQNLFNGFQTLSQLRQQDHARREQYFTFLDTSEEQGLAAARAYLDVLRLRQLLTLAVANHDSHRSIYQKIERRVGAGVAPRVDLEQAAGRLALSESNRLTAQSNLTDASEQYLRIVGRRPEENMRPLNDFPWTPPQDEAAQWQLLRYSPANLAAAASVQSARMALRGQRGTFLPRLDVRARQEWGTAAGNARRAYPYDRKVFELVGSWNLFRGGADKARLSMAAEALNTRLAHRDRVCRETRTRLVVAVHDLQKLQSKRAFLQQHALASAKVRSAYLDQFEAGKRSLLDVLDSENEWFRSEEALINGETELLLSRFKGAAASGQLLSSLQLKPVEQADFSQEDEPVPHCAG